MGQLSKVAFWKYKSRKPSHHGITFTTLSVVDNLGSIALGSDISSRRGTATRCSSVLMHTPTGPAGQTLNAAAAALQTARLEVWALSWL